MSQADPDCTSSNKTVSGNSCGIHIHAGTSCYEDALGHYFGTQDDPWGAIDYVANSDGTANGVVSVEFGYEASDIDGKAFVIHEYDGSRMTCNLLGGVSNQITYWDSVVVTTVLPDK